MQLLELQQRFRGAILGEDPALEAAIEGRGLTAAQRLQIYRNNSLISLTQALKTTFPALVRIVDERFFAFAADRFIRAQPPRQPRLAEYGADFADFLASFEPARTLPYLPDLARLEWAINQAYNAEDLPPLDVTKLATLAPEDLPSLRLRLHPASRLIASPYAIDQLWRANCPSAAADEPQPTDLDRPTGLLVQRRGFEVALIELGPAHYNFLIGLRDGATVEVAFAAASQADGAFDLSAALGAELRRGTFLEGRVDLENQP